MYNSAYNSALNAKTTCHEGLVILVFLQHIWFLWDISRYLTKLNGIWYDYALTKILATLRITVGS